MTKAHEDLLKTARARFEQAQTADQKQRERELADLRFYAGEQWDKDVLDSRKGQTLGSGTTSQVVPARPSLTINKTREPVRQVLNQERATDLGITIIPADDFGEERGPIDHTEIKLREGLVRRIQRDSEAADARTWAFARSTIAGRGFYGVMTRFVPGKTWDQEVYVQRFYNQASVSLDPAHEQPDGSDADWAFVGVDMSYDRYKAEHGTVAGGAKNDACDCSDEEWRALGDEAKGWFTKEGETRSVRVTEYYYTVRESKELALMKDGTVWWVDELPPDIDPKLIADKRKVVEKSIKWAKIDGAHVLDETDWTGHYIPIIKVLGEELQPYDGERRAEGIVAPMKDSCRGNNYVISKFVERVGLTPIAPMVMAGGQDEGFEAEWDGANTRTFGRLRYNQKDQFGVPAPPPFKPDSRADIADIAMGVQMFGQAIASTSVTPETALGNVDPSVKSGKLAKLLLQQAEQGTSNFLDNLVRSMRHEARILNDLLFPIYGRPGRLARLMNPSGEMESVLVGKPFIQQGEGPEARPQAVEPGHPEAKTFTLTKDAEFNVAVKVSKNYDTRREQEASMLGELISADPTAMAIVGDLFFKYQDGPGHEEMSERYKTVLAPPVQQLLSGKTPIPPEAQQQLAQAQQAIEMLTQQVEQQNEIIKTDVVKTQGALKQKEMQEQGDNQRTGAELAMKERLEMEKIALEHRKLEVQLEIEMAKLGSAAAAARADVEMQALHEHNTMQEAEASRNEASAQADLDRQAAQDAQANELAVQAHEGEANRQSSEKQARNKQETKPVA